MGMKPRGRPRKSPPPASPFAQWLRRELVTGRRVANIAEELGVGVSTVYALADGRFNPSVKLAIRIERLTGEEVPIRSWE